MRKKGNTVLAGLIICLLLVFLAAAGKLFGAYLKYQKGDVSYEKLQEYVQEPEEEESYRSLYQASRFPWHISLPIRIRFFTPSWALIRRWTTQERPLGS